MERLRPNNKRAKNAILLIWIMLILEVISFVSCYFQYSLLNSIVNEVDVSEETLELNDLREGIIAIVFLIVSIISIVTFIQWFRRAYFNLHIKVQPLYRTEGWAAAGWFIPFLNLFVPFHIMKDLYEKTKIYLLENGISVNKDFSTGYLGLWWTIWIINNLVSNIAVKYSINAETVDTLISSTLLEMFTKIIGIPLAVITVKVISDYAKVESLLFDVDSGIGVLGVNDEPDVLD